MPIVLQGEFKDVTVFFIDIRKYTALSDIKDSKVVINFIKEYRTLVQDVFKNELNELKDNLCDVIYIGDAVLVIFNNDSTDILKRTIKGSKIIRDKMIELLCVWSSDDSYTGERLTYFRKINFGIGISQGKIYAEDNDYIGSPLNHASKIGDTRQLSKNNTHIGINKDIFHKLDNREIDKDCECIGHPKDCKYIDLLRFEKKYGTIND